MSRQGSHGRSAGAQLSAPPAAATTGHVEAIHRCSSAGAPMEALRQAIAIAGVGLAGDRYAEGTGFYTPRPRTDGGRELTLIEAETLDALRAETGIGLDPSESRRNITTRGLRLEALIGRRFTIGDALCEGVDYCPPCQHLVDVTGKAVLEPLVGRGGIRARIVRGGDIAVGAAIEPTGEPAE
jgi:MOSC domain-containing protein YiiM